MTDEYDVIVIGAGAVGENAAASAAAHGLAVAVIERDLVGGECSYWACMPSKALLRPGKVLDALGRVPGAAGAGRNTLDSEAALEWRNEVAAHWDDSAQVEWLEGAGVELLRGRGRLTGARAVELTEADGPGRRLAARRAVVIATGSRPRTPAIDGLEEAGIWQSRDITSEIGRAHV